MALRPAPPGWQVDAIAPHLEQVLKAPGPKAKRWAALIWMAGCAEQPDLSEAAHELERLADALRVGPTARIALFQRSVDVLAIAEVVNAMAAQVRRSVRPGRPGADVASRLGEVIAVAYHDLIGSPPPSTDPYGGGAVEQSYHRLTRDLFELANLDGWAYHARNAARCVKAQKGS